MSAQNDSLRTYQAISLLLNYPETSWIADSQELLTCIEKEDQLERAALQALSTFIHELQTMDLLQLQAEYVATFDQQRALSLHLFEHVHGDSRERGQAMVDLSTIYQEHGLIISANELPDYLPLFLECLSTLPAKEANVLLQDCIHIIERITDAFAERGHRYTAVFNALLSLGNKPLKAWTVKLQSMDDPGAADRLDREWAEEEIKFLNNTCNQTKHACGSSAPIQRATYATNHDATSGE